MADDSRRLDSWKEIAAHLGRDVTTAIRWERDRGLPVHRVPGGKLSRVFAYSQELDDWLRHAEPAPPAAADDPVAPTKGDRGLRRPLFLSAAGIVAVAAIALAVWAAGPGAVALSVTGNAVVGTDRHGRQVWLHAFSGERVSSSTRVWSFDGDIDLDGRDDLFAVADIIGASSNVPISRLHRFSRDGQLLWSYAPSDRLTFGAGEYGAPWANWHIGAYRAGGEPRIAWAVHHYTWWPSLLISLDAGGRRVGTFVNAGWIARSAGIPGDRHLAVVGMSNAHRAYFLAILDAARPTAASPEPQGSETVCLSCPAEGPLHYVVFPPSDVAGHFAYPLDPPDVTLLDDGSVRVQVMETPGPNIASTVYEFDSSFSLRGIRTSDAFDAWHARLEASGALTHAAAVCPDRRARAVRRWTPASGWTE